MTCVHLRQLYKLCQDQELTIGGSDLIRIVCNQCDEHEVCPSALLSEYDSIQENEPSSNKPSTATTPSDSKQD